jgi:serine/threonine protein kinase
LTNLPFQDLYDKVEPLTRRGAYGKAFRCEKDGEVTVVKLLDESANDSDFDFAEAIERFKREIAILKQIEHKNIIRIFRVNEEEKPFWYEMEYAELGDLEQTMLDYSRDPLQIYNIFIDICLGVKCLHEQNPKIIHRDLKPRNVLLFPDEKARSKGNFDKVIAKIADLGLALTSTSDGRLTESGIALGTPDYMAPEQRANAKYIDETADIYSLGVILFEICTGHTNLQEFDTVPKFFIEIIRKATRYSSDQRYQSIDELLKDLAAIPFEEIMSAGYIHPGREFENIINYQYLPSRNITPQLLQSLAELLERAKGSDPGFVAVNTANIPIDMIKKIDARKPHYVRRLLARFVEALGKEHHPFWKEDPELYIDFLGRVYLAISSKENKELCFEKICRYAQDEGRLLAKDVVKYIIKHTSEPIDQQLIKCIIKKQQFNHIMEWILSSSEFSEMEKQFVV